MMSFISHATLVSILYSTPKNGTKWWKPILSAPSSFWLPCWLFNTSPFHSKWKIFSIRIFGRHFTRHFCLSLSLSFLGLRWCIFRPSYVGSFLLWLWRLLWQKNVRYVYCIGFISFLYIFFSYICRDNFHYDLSCRALLQCLPQGVASFSRSIAASRGLTQLLSAWVVIILFVVACAPLVYTLNRIYNIW